MTLSPSHSRILACLKRNGFRSLPEGAVLKNAGPFAFTLITRLGCRWEWSWTINQEAHTSDYRRRLFEMRQQGYVIISFYVGNRHGYILAAEAGKEENER